MNLQPTNNEMMKYARYTLSVFTASAIAFTLLPSPHVRAKPDGWRCAHVLEQGSCMWRRVNLNHNSPETIRKEILNPELIRNIAQANGLTDKDLATVKLEFDEDRDTTMLYLTGSNTNVYNLLGERLKNYIRKREAGHTRAYCLASITNTPSASDDMPTDIKVLLTKRRDIPPSWLKKEDSVTTTNQAGEVSRRCVYTITDGDITWRYSMSFRPDGSLDYVFDSRVDAKEFDPRFRKTIAEVNAEADKKLKAEGLSGKLGSCHRFWMLKKELLAARGIRWRSPAELNPNTNFD